MKKELTLQDIQDSIVDLKETTIKDIQDSIVDLKESIVDVKESLGSRIDDLHEAMNVHSTEMDRQFRVVHSTMATKDFVTEKIGELRGEFFSSGQRPARRTKAVA